MWTEIIKTLGVTTILVAVVSWLARSIILHFLSKDIETYKADLRIGMLEHEIRFRRVDEKVAEHLAELYGRLDKLYEAVDSYVREIEWSHEPPKEEKLKLVEEAKQELKEFLFPKRCYIPLQLFRRAKELGDNLSRIAIDFTFELAQERKGTPTKGKTEWLTGMDAIKEEATPLFEEIVAAFQKRLGVTDDEEFQTSPSPHLQARPNQPHEDD